MRDTIGKTIVHHTSDSEMDFYKVDVNGDWIHVNPGFGEMRMRQWVFDGVRMGYSEWSLTKSLSLDWSGDSEVVTMYFSLKGLMNINDSAEYLISLGNNQQNMFYGSHAGGTMKVDDLQLRSFMIQFEKKAFLRVAAGGSDALKYFAEKILAKQPVTFSRNPLPIDLNTQTAISAILNCGFNASLKKVFLMSKAMELLVYLADLHSKLDNKSFSVIKSSYDRERLCFAREYMRNHMDTPPTIPELAKLAGINEFKLKKGYKELFGITIFGDLAETRLQLSRELLNQGTKSMSEIANELGYSSVQHFNTAFKKKFSVTPRQAKWPLL